MSDRNRGVDYLTPLDDINVKIEKFRDFLEHHLDDDSVREYLIGVSLAFDPLPFDRYKTFFESDYLALLHDWEAVGDDFRIVIKRHHDEISSQTKAARPVEHESA